MKSRIPLLLLIFLCSSFCLSGQGINDLSVRFHTLYNGSDFKDFQTHDSSSSGFQKARVFGNSVRVSYEKGITNGRFIRFLAGIQFAHQKAQTEHIGLNQRNTVLSYTRYGINAGVGFGQTLAFDRLILKFGGEYNLTYTLPYQTVTTTDFIAAPDNEYSRFVRDRGSHKAIINNVGIFVGLNYHLGKRVYLGMETQISLGIGHSWGIIEDHRNTFDENGELLESQVFIDRFKQTQFLSPFYLSPPAIILTYQFKTNEKK